MKLTNHYLLMAATVAAAMLLNPQRSLADDDLVEAYQFTATTMAGSSVSVILAKSDDKEEGPRMLHKDRVFRLDGKEINASDIQYIRIAKTMVSAVREVNVQPVPHADNNIYSINGQLVRKNVKTVNALKGLPAGIYVVGGKKFIVK